MKNEVNETIEKLNLERQQSDIEKKQIELMKEEKELRYIEKKQKQLIKLAHLKGFKRVFYFLKIRGLILLSVCIPIFIVFLILSFFTLREHPSLLLLNLMGTMLFGSLYLFSIDTLFPSFLSEDCIFICFFNKEKTIDNLINTEGKIDQKKLRIQQLKKQVSYLKKKLAS